MGSILRDDERAELRRRLGTLTETSTARWGRMNVAAMLAHLVQSSRLALGELPVASKNMRIFQVFPVKQLILYVIPFPKGAMTAQELLVASPQPFDAGRSELLALLERLAAGPQEGPGPEHPLFGPLSRQEWGALMHKHLDHHLRQFGA